MTIKRRQFVAVTVLGGVSILAGAPEQASAASVPAAVVPAPGQLLSSLFFSFLWDNVLQPAAIAAIKSLAMSACAGIGRHFGIESESSSPSTGGGHAVITMSIRKHPAGHLMINADMPDGKGGHAFTHSGTAPGHEHPSMRSHIEQVVAKAHAHLSAHGS